MVPNGTQAVKKLILVASPARLELATLGLGNRCSIRLSYGDFRLVFRKLLHVLKKFRPLSSNAL